MRSEELKEMLQDEGVSNPIKGAAAKELAVLKAMNSQRNSMRGLAKAAAETERLKAKSQLHCTTTGTTALAEWRTNTSRLSKAQRVRCWSDWSQASTPPR